MPQPLNNKVPNSEKWGLTSGFQLYLIEMESAHYVRGDQHGNRFLYPAKVSDMKDARVVRWAWDVALATTP